MRPCLYLLCSALYGAFALQLPSYIERCPKSDPNLEKCILDQANKVIPLIAPNGDEEYLIPPSDPLIIEKLEFSPGEARLQVKTKHATLEDVNVKAPSSAISLHIVAKNLSVSGLANTSIVSLKFNYSDPKHHYDMRLYVPRTEILGHYTASGKVLLLPINGDGEMSINITDVYANLSFDNIREKDSDGFEFATPTNPQFDFDVQGGMEIHLSQLFNGNKLLADNMNNFLNENWQEVMKEVGPTIAEAMEKIAMFIMTKIFQQVPLEEAFGD